MLSCSQAQFAAVDGQQLLELALPLEIYQGS